MIAMGRGVCGNDGLTSGVYGATLGAGGATGAEPSAFGQNPAVLDANQVGMVLNYHRPFAMDEVGVSEMDVYANLRRGGIGAQWRQTEVADLYQEQAWTVDPVWRVFDRRGALPGRLDIGATWTCRRIDELGLLTTRTNWSQGFGVAWRLLPQLKVGAFASGLDWDPRAALSLRSEASTDRILQWGFEADSRPGSGAGISGSGPSQIFRMDFRKTGFMPWRTLAALSVSPWSALQLTAGIANPPFQVSLGIRIRLVGVRIDQSWRYHRYLGRTWLSSAGYSRPFGAD